jgi:hypothetical protein
MIIVDRALSEREQASKLQNGQRTYYCFTRPTIFVISGLMAKKCWFFIVGISANTSESMHPDDAVRGLDVDGIFV